MAMRRRFDGAAMLALRRRSDGAATSLRWRCDVARMALWLEWRCDVARMNHYAHAHAHEDASKPSLTREKSPESHSWRTSMQRVW